jgi:Methyltransferase domain
MTGQLKHPREGGDVDWANVTGAVLARAADPAGDDDVARLLAAVLHAYRSSGRYPELFANAQALGVHMTPVQYDFPVPNTSALPDALWERESELVGLDLNVEGQLHLLREVFPSFRAEYETFATAPTGVPHEFHLNNDKFDGTDALALYCMVRHLKPNLVVEIGSGFSSRVAARAAAKNGATRLVCIEPYPEPVLRAGFPGLSELRELQVQEVPLEDFERLGAGDILFIDSSHVVAIGSDVNYLMLEVLPRLRPGVVVHVHDVFLPKEYPRDWIYKRHYFWTEQYLLQAFLAFNEVFEILLSNSYLGLHHREEVRQTFPSAPWWSGGSIWLRRKRLAQAL